MQRFMQNMLAAAAVVGFTVFSAGAVFAHGGGGGHGGGGHSGGGRSMGGNAAHRSVSSTKGRTTGETKRIKTLKNDLTINHPNPNQPGHPPRFPRPPRHPWPPYHMHYPVGFWFSLGVDGDCGCDADAGIDVEFTSIRQLDAGDASQNLGPAYRVWFHNNTDADINQAFDVAILASNSTTLATDLPYAAVRVDSIAADETMSVDIRLPIGAMTMSNSNGSQGPFADLHTVIDSQDELVETNKVNNHFVAARTDIPMLSDE